MNALDNLRALDRIATLMNCQPEDNDDLVEAVRLVVAERDAARAAVARLRPVVEAAHAWGAVQCACATGALEPTATALAKALVALAGVQP